MEADGTAQAKARRHKIRFSCYVLESQDRELVPATINSSGIFSCSGKERGTGVANSGARRVAATVTIGRSAVGSLPLRLRLHFWRSTPAF